MSKRTTSQASLFTYFTKAQKTDTASDSSTSARPIVSETSTSSSFSTCTEISEVRPEESNLLIHHFDLGNYVGNKLDDDLKFKLLSTPWTPGKDFKFPVSVSGKKNLRFQSQWLDRYPWLVYTKKDGALCKYCVIFSHHTVGKGSNQTSKSLVTVPYKKWKHAIEDFESHQSKQYHHEAVVKGSNFLKTMQNKHLDIRNVIDSGRKKQVEENRDKLFSIVETIKFCGRQELALRGTNDSGPVSVTDEEPVTNDGNFRAILRMRMKCGDTKLLKHCENIALNATYMSAKVQNDLISICGEIIQKEIVKCLNKAKVFSILVDETADISGHEQLSLCVRYTKKVETCYVVKEDFLGFVKVDNTTAQSLADTIIASLKNLDIDCNKMVGQGYDGAAVMKGGFNGVQAIIRKSFPRALFVHCSSHSLNLALCHSCSVPPIRNCIGTVKAIGNFLRASPKRTSFLQARIRANFPDATWQKLTPMCETRWVENHNGLLKFKQIFKSIVETLEQFSTDQDMETSTKASSFLRSALGSEFVVSLCFLAKVFEATLTVCKVLQSPLCDLITAVDHIENVILHFQDIRSNIEKEFSNSFTEAKDLLTDVNEEIKLPRLTSVQKHRANPNINNPEQYYRITVAIPLLEDLTSQLKIRFTDHKKVIAAMYTLIPTVCSEKETPFPREDLVMYEDLVELDEAQGEFKLWKLLWQGKNPSDRPSCAIEAVGECNSQLYPNIYMLLNILSTLPVTTCTPERSFSTLRRLKTYLRNSCGQERLTGLALMAIHRDVIIPTDDVITEFAHKKSRRLDFVL